MKDDKVMPEDKWKFDGDVTECFDNMLQRCIPQYDVMRQAVTSIAKRYRKPNTHIIDVGTSLGQSLEPLVEAFGNENSYIGLEISDDMLKAARKKFESAIKDGYVSIQKHDLREGVGKACIRGHLRASVVLSVLTLQFTPLEYRPHILKTIYDSLIPGGVFILVEKVLGQSASLDSMFVDTYYDMKRQNNYTEEQIERKRLSLEGVLVPIHAKWNEDLLQVAGFHPVECFWRWMNFAGWVGVKP